MSDLDTVPPNAPDLFDTQETAAFLRISVSTLERMRLDGSGPSFIKLGMGKKRARVVYSRTAILAWLSAQSFSATSQYAGLTTPPPSRKNS